MNLNLKSFFLPLFIISIIALPASSMAATPYIQEQPQTAVRISPAQIENLEPGDSFTINVSTETSAHLESTDVYAFQVDIHFDPTVLRVDNIEPISASEFPLLAQNSSNLFDETDNLTYAGPTYGQVYYVASRNDLASSLGANGGTVLFTVTFTVVSAGSSSIQLMQYPGNGSNVGTYFMTSQPSPTSGYVEIIPLLYSADYGNPPSASSTPTAPNDNLQLVTGNILTYLIPLALAVVFIGVLRRKIKSKKQDESIPVFPVSPRNS